MKTSFEQRRCRICACTDTDCGVCVDATGEPCGWIAEDVCSACVGVTRTLVTAGWSPGAGRSWHRPARAGDTGNGVTVANGTAIADDAFAAVAADAWSDLRRSTREPRIDLSMTPAQATATALALDTFSRLAMGQLTIVADLVIDGHVASCDASLPPPALTRKVRETMDEIRAALGHQRGAYLGIGSPKVGKTAKRCYEVEKVLLRVLALLRDPDPTFRDVDYDGLSMRYTQDPTPEATVRGAPI